MGSGIRPRQGAAAGNRAAGASRCVRCLRAPVRPEARKHRPGPRARAWARRLGDPGRAAPRPRPVPPPPRSPYDPRARPGRPADPFHRVPPPRPAPAARGSGRLPGDRPVRSRGRDAARPGTAFRPRGLAIYPDDGFDYQVRLRPSPGSTGNGAEPSVYCGFETPDGATMASPAIPVFLAGPYPVLQSASIDDQESEVDLDVALLINGQPTMLASTTFPLDETWDRILTALTSGDARLGVAGMPHESKSITGAPEVFPSAYVGLECANGERLVLAHIKGLDAEQNAEAYAREVIDGIIAGATPDELGETIDDEMNETIDGEE